MISPDFPGIKRVLDEVSGVHYNDFSLARSAPCRSDVFLGSICVAGAHISVLAKVFILSCSIAANNRHFADGNSAG